jgi:hypothetical protein
MKKLFCRGLLGLGLCSGVSAFAGIEQEEAAEIEHYVTVFSGPAENSLKIPCRELHWKGITDVRVYDLVAQKLRELLPAAQDIGIAGGRATDTVAWCAKALGVSGMEKYIPVLEEMAALKKGGLKAPSPKLKSYASEAKAMLVQYRLWNPIIADKKNFRDDQPLQVNRYVNMLRSSEQELRGMAVERIYEDQVYNEYLLDVLWEELQKLHQSFGTDGFDSRMFKAMVKSLSSSRNRKYYDGLVAIKDTFKGKRNGKYLAFMHETINEYYKK